MSLGTAIPVSIDPCGPRAPSCRDGGCPSLHWMCDTWRDCTDSSGDKCRSPSSPPPGEKPRAGWAPVANWWLRPYLPRDGGLTILTLSESWW